MAIDRDLESIQEVRDKVEKAKQAQLEFKHFNQEQVDKVVKAIADAGYKAAENLAKLACEETGFGKISDKITKNQFGTRNIYNSIKDLKTVGVISVEQNGKIIKIAEPMGVVAGLIPSTNPTSTVMFKALISLKCRNSIVASPHPKAVKSTLEAVKIISEAAEKAGAPKGLIQCLSNPTLAGTDSLMKHKDISVILATGSTQMVKAAYSTGNPAYGVGAGNVPAFIERTANVSKAVADIIYGTTFDNGTLCSSEQAMIVDRPIREKVIEEAKKWNAYFLNDQEKTKLENVTFIDGKLNPAIVGKSADYIAKMAGIQVPLNTSVLIAFTDKVGKQELLSGEKLSPLLAFYTVDGWLDGCHKCIELLNYGGIGHSLVIHSNDKEIIMKFALEKPAFRIVVNTPSSLGAVGFTTALLPSLTLGVGTWGGSIISENVSAKHLMNTKTLAFETNPVNEGYCLTAFDQLASKQGDVSGKYIDIIEERLRDRAGNPTFESINFKKNATAKKNFGSGLSKDAVDKIIKEFNT